MTRNQLSTIAIAISALFAGQAMAANDAPITRAQVQAEMAEAISKGNMIVGEGGERLNEIFPHNYQTQKSESMTRGEVQAELAEAIRNGNVVVDQSGARLNEVFPHNYAQQNAASKSRAQVNAELADAAARGQLYRHIEA